MSALRNHKPGTLKKNDVAKSCADIFGRIICRYGCRSSVLTGMKVKELQNCSRRQSGKFSISVEEQKEK